MKRSWTIRGLAFLIPMLGCGGNNSNINSNKDAANRSSAVTGIAAAESPEAVTRDAGSEPIADATRSQALTLEQRTGAAPLVRNAVPHQQRDQNSPPDQLDDLASFLFGLEHVEEKSSRGSFPSARGAFIKKGVAMNAAIRREFTHIHMEPGPGSQHLVLKEDDFLLATKKGWGIKHPWSDRFAKKGLVLMMVYAPRDERDLVQIKKIIVAAWRLALSE